MATVDQAIDELANKELWTQSAKDLAGAGIPFLAEHVLEGVSPWDLPDPLYGAGVIAVGSMAIDLPAEMKVGAGGYTLYRGANELGADPAQMLANIGEGI